MDNKLNLPPLGESGQRAYALFKDAIRDFNMAPMLADGVIVGLSGGADSVLLLRFLLRYRAENSYFPILAVHVNHMIRGEEADRDESFSCSLCRALDVEFMAVRVNVPEYSKQNGIGLEEAARKVRYSKFQEIICGRNDISTVCVAHNATDNLETTLFNMMRGAGTRGASGISPTRDYIARPLIYVSKSLVIDTLSEMGAEYATDSTNVSTDYSRNFIRHRILPLLGEITKSPEAAATRLSRNLRRDDDFIRTCASDFLSKHSVIKNTDLAALHISVFTRVIIMMCSSVGASVEETHVSKIYSLLREDSFQYSIPGKAKFVCERGVCTVVEENTDSFDFCSEIKTGKNSFDEYDADILLSDSKFGESSLNVYKISIQANLSSAIIKGGLFVRPKQDGDTIFYGGHNRKLKKIFCDLKIPVSLRQAIPILCDEKGVVWVPGVGVRDDFAAPDDKKNLYVALCIGKREELSAHRMISASEFRI